jgi:hypothetical protein
MTAGPTDAIWIDGIPWIIDGRILLPRSMPHAIGTVDRQKVRKVLSATGSLLARWTTTWNREQSEWWWTCCDDKDYDIERIPVKNARRDIRKGLRCCRVRRLSLDEYGTLTYDVAAEATRVSKHRLILASDSEQHRRGIYTMAERCETEIWGAFADDRLAAYAVCLLADNAVSVCTVRSNPLLHNYCPNNALFYEITRHYLRERGKLYITNGSRTLLHPTTINDFLLRMGYRRIYCRLNTELSATARTILHSQVGRWGKYVGAAALLGPRWANIEAFFKLMEISRTFGPAD